MANVLILRKELQRRPKLDRPRIRARLRQYSPGDVSHWLRLQAAAMPASQAGRHWTNDDFVREFLSRFWWSPDRMLFCITESNRVVGTVTLGERGTEHDGVTANCPGTRREGAIHWLLVAPDFQRRGIATCLISRLEQMAWDRGWRWITLETLSSWSTAIAFYRARAYKSVD